MFCVNCGSSLPELARFCSSCGHSLGGPSPVQGQSPLAHHSPQHAHAQYAHVNSPSLNQGPGQVPQAHYPQGYPQDPLLPSYESQIPHQQGHIHQTTHHATPIASATPPAHNTVLLSPTGYPQPAFESLAAALFHGLDQQVAPQRTGMLEANKMMCYRTFGGLTVPPYFSEHVLPTYAATIGFELAPNRPRNEPVVTWNGWHQYLLHKIRLEPDTTFAHVMRVGAAMGLQFHLKRTDFPAMPDPAAQAKETEFKTKIFAMARGASGAGAVGSHVGVGVHATSASTTTHSHTSGSHGSHGHHNAENGAVMALGIIKNVTKFANSQAGQNLLGGGSGS